MKTPCPYCRKKATILDDEKMEGDAACFRCECEYCGQMFDVEIIVYKLDEDER